MLNAGWQGIVQFVIVKQGMRVIRIEFVKNVSISIFTLISNQSQISQSTFFIHWYLAGCKSDDECPLTQACIQRECQDPCPFEQCGIKAFCTVNVHKARCQCPSNHKGSPYIECKPYECLTDPECPDTLACRNEKCVDPCDCARNAVCDARNHGGYCTCLPDFPIGDPYVDGCEKRKIRLVKWKDRIVY